MKTFLKINNGIKKYDYNNTNFECKDDVLYGKQGVMFIDNQCNSCNKDILGCLELIVCKNGGDVFGTIHQNNKQKPNIVKTNYIKKFGKKTLHTLVKFFGDLSDNYLGCDKC